jgi:hypothetical protein
MLENERILDKLDELAEKLGDIEVCVARIDERGTAFGLRLEVVEKGFRKSTWALIAALTSILGTGALLLLTVI